MSEKQPVYNPHRGWREWFLPETWTGPGGSGVYVPNVNDRLFSYEKGFERVTWVEDTYPHRYTSEPWNPPRKAEDIEGLDLLRGSGPGYRSESYRLLVDDSQMPARVAVKGSAFVNARDASYAKLFRGNDFENGEVISKFFDDSMTLLGENIPLELVAMPDHQNYGVKTVKPFHITHSLTEREEVTLVFYGANNRKLSEANLLVTKTGFVRGIEAGQRYITDLELITPWRDVNDPNLLVFPVNITMSSISFFAKAVYSDGSKSKNLPIDGTKVRLDGLDSYLPTNTGDPVNLVLSYQLGPNENAYGMIGISNNFPKVYRAVTGPVQGAYSVRLFGFPCWNRDISSYELHWFLYNLDRDQWYSCDDNVELAQNSPAFDGRKFGEIQDMTFVVDLSKIDRRFASYRHEQKLRLTLKRTYDANEELWELYQEVGQNPGYGKGLAALFTHVSGANYTVRLDSGFTLLDDWLQHVYYDVKPIINPMVETKPPRPTHFVLNTGSVTQEYTLEAWNTELVSVQEVRPGENVYLHWIRRDGNTDLQLGVSAIPVNHATTV